VKSSGNFLTAIFKNLFVIVFLVLLVIYGITGFFVLPPMVEDTLKSVVYEQTGRDLHLDKVKINPFALTVRIEGFSIPGENSEDLSGFKQLYVNVKAIALFWLSVHVDDIVLEEPFGNLIIGSDGKWNFSDILDNITANGAAEAEPEETDADKQPVHVSISRIDIHGGHVRFQDQALETPADITLSDIRLNVSGFSTKPGTPFKTGFSAILQNRGQIKLDGYSKLFPLHSKLEATLKTIPLSLAQPFVNETMAISIQNGNMDLNANIELEQKPDDTLSGLITVNTDTNDLHIIENMTGNDLFRMKKLSIEGVHISLKPSDLSIGRIFLSDPEIYAGVLENGQLTVSLLSKPSKKELPVEEKKPVQVTAMGKEKEPSDPLKFKITAIDMTNGMVTFTDQSVKPECRVVLSGLNASLKNISSDPATTSGIEIQGKLDPYAPFTVSGEFALLSQRPFNFLNMNLTDVDLKNFSPYAGKYMGKEIEKGKLNLSLDYKIAERKLTARNTVFMDQFTLGKKVDSKDAVKLPVELAIGLLKNLKGEIHVDLPVEGNLDDPEFKYGRTVLNAIANLITKAATSPFKLLADIVGGGEDLGNIRFSPGDDLLSKESQKKVSDLAKALHERPKLNIEIKGTYDPMKDRDVLAKRKKNQKISETMLVTLAEKRAEAIRKKLVSGGLETRRIFMTAVQKKESKDSIGVDSILILKTN